MIVGSEAMPFVKTGGLADVLGALPPALARLGWDVTLVMPRYRGVDAGGKRRQVQLLVGGFSADAAVYEAALDDGARALLVDVPELFDREELYAVGNTDYPDNARRFAVLARAALDLAIAGGVRPSVIHAHEWQAGLVPVYLRTIYAGQPLLAGVPCVFTIHNLAHQGLFEPDWLPRVDLPWSQLGLDRMEFWGRISFLKGGISGALPQLEAAFVLLGTGEERYEQRWRQLAASHPDRIGARIGFDERLAHLLEGGADMFLMPSRFEPCGLNQMYSLRYGTVPIVRAVGGLADTVSEAPFDGDGREPNGFVFHDYTPQALLETLRRALASYSDREMAGASAGRHEAGPFLGPFGWRVRQNIRAALA